MPAFIKTPKDEKRWSEAKQAASKSKSKDESSFTDQDWALVNHIYQNMNKAEAAEELLDILKKARNKLSDEYDPEEEKYGDLDPDEIEAMNVFDPSESEDDADKWLKENDPKSGETDEGNDEEANAQAQDDARAPAKTGTSAKEQKQEQEQKGSGKAEVSPSSQQEKISDLDPERLKKLKDVAGHWLAYADQVRKMSADAKKNPHLFAEGHRMAANNTAHEDFNEAYHSFINSPEYQKLSPTKQMRAEMKFKKEWKEKNPDYHKNAVKAVSQAHGMHSKARELHGKEREAQIAHILSGGQSVGSGDTMSAQEAAQHVGAGKGEEGYVSSTVQDPSASFARTNKEFLATLDKPKLTMEDYEELESPEMKAIKHRSLNDPENKKLLNDFFKEHHPLIERNARRMKSQAQAAGIPEDKLDESALHEAGMHGLMQAIKDYSSDVGSFKTHANSKISGLMQSHLASQDVVPKSLRAKAKAYEKQKSAPQPEAQPQSQAQPQVEAPKPEAPKVDLNQAISKHPNAGDISDRLKRVITRKKVQ